LISSKLATIKSTAGQRDIKWQDDRGEPMDAVSIIVLSTLVLGPYLAIRIKGYPGIIIGALIIWLVPVAVRSLMCFAGATEYGGFGVMVHLLTGWFFGYLYCAVARLISEKITKRIRGHSNDAA
jgi:hypothetical protein